MQITRDMEREIDGVLVNAEVAAYRARLGQMTASRSIGLGLTRKSSDGPVSAYPAKPSPTPGSAMSSG